MKKIIAFLILIPTLAFAQPKFPESTVWVEPEDAKPGEEIGLNAFIYNPENQEITFTVSFQNELEEELVQATTEIPAETAKAVVATWKQPKDEVTVTAVVIHAKTKQKKEIKSLHGEVGRIVVGGIEEKKETKNISIPLPSKEAVYAWIGTNLSTIEAFREKQSDKFEKLRDESREKTSTKTTRDIIEVIDQETGETRETVEPVEYPKASEYAKTVMYTSLAALFSNKALFYIALVIATLFVIRFILSRFI